MHRKTPLPPTSLPKEDQCFKRSTNNCQLRILLFISEGESGVLFAFRRRAVAYFCVRSPVWSQDRDGSESGNWQRNQKKVCAPSSHQRRLLKPRLLLNSLSLRHRGKRSMWRREREGETSPEWEKRDEIKHISP